MKKNQPINIKQYHGQLGNFLFRQIKKKKKNSFLKILTNKLRLDGGDRKGKSLRDIREQLR